MHKLDNIPLGINILEFGWDVGTLCKAEAHQYKRTQVVICCRMC